MLYPQMNFVLALVLATSTSKKVNLIQNKDTKHGTIHLQKKKKYMKKSIERKENKKGRKKRTKERREKAFPFPDSQILDFQKIKIVARELE